MKVKTSELTDAALDWAVAKCEYDGLSMQVIQYPAYAGTVPIPHPSTNWAQGGPIIEREGITLRCGVNGWDAELPEFYILHHGNSALVAAMRCYVASKLGDDIDVPKELT